MLSGGDERYHHLGMDALITLCSWGLFGHGYIARTVFHNRHYCYDTMAGRRAQLDPDSLGSLYSRLEQVSFKRLKLPSLPRGGKNMVVPPHGELHTLFRK